MEASPTKNMDSLNLKPLEKLLKQYSGKKGVLIPLLQKTQQIYGYLPKITLIKIAESLNMDVSRVYGVATFYAQFRLTPVG
ncbi:MAG: NAD(P)H-dependent oxidoreductase subunit E, partial [Calditrichaeota bacterium]|nr:NAD(P)H-dependent oxidoreductase subunit E [Calditrichota bacterium]